MIKTHVMNIKSIFFAINLLLIMNCLNAKEHHIQFDIEGIKFDSIKAKIAIPGQWQTYYGESENNYIWNFYIPDSIISAHFIFNAKGYITNEKGLVKEYLFMYNRKDSVRFGTILINNEDRIPINLKFLKFSSTDDIYSAEFLLKEGTDSEVDLSILFYSKYFEWDDSLTYNEILNDCIQLLKKYPDSYTLSKVIKMMIDWPTIEDAQKIYSLFSDRIKASPQGHYMQDYIDRKKRFTEFENIKLPNWKTEKLEYIIQDSSKYCLVAFSASWCGPCHEQIPVLKRIFNEFKDKVDIVYISTDRKNTLDAWKKLMVEKDIPWRSLITAFEKESVSEKYFITFIPFTYLIHPNGTFEEFDVRTKENQKKLESLLN